MQDVWDFAVIGGGASGMIAAISASELGDRVLLLEKNPSLGKKIAASGNGRCNLMHRIQNRYFGDPVFAEKVMGHFHTENLTAFWKGLGLLLTEESDGRFYPYTYHSSSVVDALKVRLHKNSVQCRLGEKVDEIGQENASFRITAGGQKWFARRILLATGGAAFPKLGGSPCGYSFLQSFGHRVIPPSPALCPICTDTRSISGLAGIRVRCTVSLLDRNRCSVFQTKGELLFTEYGISGICAMQCARFARQGYSVELNLIDSLFAGEKDIMQYLKQMRDMNADCSAEYLLTGILLPKLSYAVLKQAGIDMRNRKAGTLADAELQRLSERLRAYSLRIEGTKGLQDSQVTAGGADCSEFSPDTLESHLVPGLHASGELLNVDGDCGGFNLMFAAATGILSGRNGRA